MPVETLSHLIIYGFTALGLLATPASLEKYKWVILYWFLILNMVLFSGTADFHWFGVPIVKLGLSQIPWLTVAFFFGFTRKPGQVVLTREWGYWCFFRVLSLHYFLYLQTDELPLFFVLGTSTFEVLVGISSWVLFRPSRRKPVSRMKFLIWNAAGLWSAWMINFQVHLNMIWEPHQPLWRDLASYFNQFPEVWIAMFWAPLSLCIHTVLFFRFISPGRAR